MEIETPHCILEKIDSQIITSIFENEDRYAETIFKKDTENYRKMYESGIDTYKTTLLFFLIIHKETNETIGECGYHTWFPKHNRAEIYYKLNDDNYKRKGYLTEILPFVIKYGFKEMKLHRIEALVATDNIPSLKLLKKNNFIFEGTLREHYFTNGVYENSEIYSLLAPDSNL